MERFKTFRDSEEENTKLIIIVMVTNFLIWCSGANSEILQQCPTDKNKYVGIGATIFITSILAVVSGSYFLSFVFTDKSTGNIEVPLFVLVVFGLLWGALIFNLDRSIIISIKKTGEWKEEFKQASLRVILALFIGIVIATPIELKLFEDEVNAKVEMNLKDQIRESRQKNISTYALELKAVENDIIKLESQIALIQKRRNKLYEEFKSEAEGTAGTLKIGKGPVYDEKKAEFDKIDNEYNNLRSSINQKNSEKKQFFEKINSQGAEDERSINNINGPEAKIKALYQLSGVHWFLTILFILLETLPVLSKLLSKRGPYDEILERIEHEHFIEQKRIISDRNDEVNNLIAEIKQLNKLKGEVRLRTEKSKLDAEFKLNDELLKDIAAKQTDIAKLLVDKWHQEQLNNVKNNSSQAYVNKQGIKINHSVLSKIENKLWTVQKPNNICDEFYYFKSGQSLPNEVNYISGGTSVKGVWEFTNNNNGIKMDINNVEYEYSLDKLSDNYVLLNGTNPIELVGV